jgi:hypothetical protein
MTDNYRVMLELEGDESHVKHRGVPRKTGKNKNGIWNCS